VIPLLPTTPFLLLAALCYMRGSPRLYHALLRNRILGSYLRNYLEGRVMSLKNKIWTLSLLWIVIISVALLATDNLVVRMILGAVAIGVTVYIILIKSENRSVSALSIEPHKESSHPL
jgi:uncharacterized membrane protein YbaN (DUF454 family)